MSDSDDETYMLEAMAGMGPYAPQLPDKTLELIARARMADRFADPDTHRVIAEMADILASHHAAANELGWQPIETAPRDGTRILAFYRSLDGYAMQLDGRVFQVRHEGKTPSDYDLGWQLFPGHGGVPDKCLAGWMPSPAPPPAITNRSAT